jgi:hypothetical protein
MVLLETKGQQLLDVEAEVVSAAGSDGIVSRDGEKS